MTNQDTQQESTDSRPERLLPKYSVKQTAELTGLTLNQVRLWERRYQLVEPQRGSNGYRLYSQQDLDILRYVRRQIQKGITIQVISEQIQQDREGVLKQLASQKKGAPRRILSLDPRRLPNYDLMMHAVRNGDPLKFERLLIQAQAGKNFAEALRTMDLPILAHIGEMTAHGQINLACCHLAAAIIRRRILVHVQNLALPRTSPMVILACAPQDYHELGLLSCLLELTQQLVPSLYLGPNVPISEIQYYCLKIKPRAVLVSVTAPVQQDQAQEMAYALAQISQQGSPVALGGFEAERKQALFANYGLQFLPAIESILDWAPIAKF